MAVFSPLGSWVGLWLSSKRLGAVCRLAEQFGNPAYAWVWRQMPDQHCRQWRQKGQELKVSLSRREGSESSPAFKDKHVNEQTD